MRRVGRPAPRRPGALPQRRGRPAAGTSPGFPRAEIREMYQQLGDLVAEGALRAAVEQVYPLDAFKEAFTQSLQSQRSGKILFTCGAPEGAMPAKAPATTTKPAFR